MTDIVAWRWRFKGHGPNAPWYYTTELQQPESYKEMQGLVLAPEWQPIETCPIRKDVDLWCVYGGEEFAQFNGGSPIGKLVSNRFKTTEYGFFGNQSNDGVPQKDAPDLKPVAWRPAVPFCPAELIAKVLGIPLTFEDATGGSNG